MIDETAVVAELIKLRDQNIEMYHDHYAVNRGINMAIGIINKTAENTAAVNAETERGMYIPLPDNIELLRDCVKVYGAEAQTDVAIEEMSELVKALIKRRRYAGENEGTVFNLERDVSEEMADVMIMWLQLLIMHDNGQMVKEWMNYKQDRSKRRLQSYQKALEEGREKECEKE